MLGTLDFTGSEQWAPFDVIFFIEQSLVPTLLTNHTNRELEKFKDWSLRYSNWQGLSPMQYFLNKANVLCKVFRDGLFSWKRSPPRRIKSTCWKKKPKITTKWINYYLLLCWQSWSLGWDQPSNITSRIQAFGQSFAVRKIEGRSMLWTCEILGAQHLILGKKLRFSSCPRVQVGHQGPPCTARALPCAGGRSFENKH